MSDAAVEAARNFSYETIRDMSVRGGYHYRVRDAADNRIATCYVEENARFIVDQLNAAADLTARLASATQENERMLKCLRTLHDQCFNAGYSVDEYHDAMMEARAIVAALTSTAGGVSNG